MPEIGVGKTVTFGRVPVGLGPGDLRCLPGLVVLAQLAAVAVEHVRVAALACVPVPM